MDNDYDDDGNNIVPCPICMSKYCPSKEDGKCPGEDMFALEGEIRMLLSEYKETGDNSRIANVLEAVEHLLTNKDQELQKAREETITKHFTSIGMVHLNAFCKLLKSQHSKGKDVMYTVRRTEQYPFIFETKADVAKEVGKYIHSELDQPNK